LYLARKIMRTKKTTLGKAIKDIEQGNAWDESDEVVKVEVKKPLDKVIKHTCHPPTSDRCGLYLYDGYIMHRSAHSSIQKYFQYLIEIKSVRYVTD
jgi:hypothetical protein